MTFAYPLQDSAALYDPKQAEEYLSTIFRHVDWLDGEIVSLLGIGEKGTPKETEAFRERKFVAPAFMGGAHEHMKRWAAYHVASFVVPAVLNGRTVEDGDVKRDKVLALTAIILDIDSGDTDKKAAYVKEALGEPSMVVASGGLTELNKPKLHLYYLLNEPSEEVDRVAELRKTLAAKVGGDQSFGRATQVVRVAGSVHAKNGKASVCKIIARSKAEYSLDDLAEAIEGLRQMEGVEPPKPKNELPTIGANGLMDFTPPSDTAIDALHRQIHEGGDELTRWGEFSKVAGFQIAEARAGRIALEQAYLNTQGWMLANMVPPWPTERLDGEFKRLVNVDIGSHGPFPLSPVQQAQQQIAASTALTPTPALFPVPSSIPPRPWLLGRWLMRGKVTAMIAPGGVGKSSLVNAIMLSLASGRQLLGKTVYGGPLRAWYWNLEDDGDSLARQRVAAAIYHGVRQTEIEGRLFVDSGPEGAELCVAVEDRNGFTIIEPVFHNIVAAIKANKIDALIIDPFVSSHRVNENDNNKIDAVAKFWARVAVATGCAIVLVHHTAKLHGESVTADSSRGAGALNNAARITLVLNRMTPEQAGMFGLDPTKHRSFFSVADDKHNLAPANRADWFELKSVSLNNGTDVHEPDSVGVVAPYHPPSIMDGVDFDHLRQIQNVLANGTYWLDAQSKKDWAGDVVAEVLGEDSVAAKSRKKIVARLESWIESGALKVEARRDDAPGKRRMRDAVTIGKPVVHLGDPQTPTMETDNGR